MITFDRIVDKCHNSSIFIDCLIRYNSRAPHKNSDPLNDRYKEVQSTIKTERTGRFQQGDGKWCFRQRPRDVRVLKLTSGHDPWNRSYTSPDRYVRLVHISELGGMFPVHATSLRCTTQCWHSVLTYIKSTKSWIIRFSCSFFLPVIKHHDIWQVHHIMVIYEKSHSEKTHTSHKTFLCWISTT